MKTILAFILSFNLSAATLHVSKTGADTNPGTEASPFLSVNRGMAMAQPGDTVTVGPGHYPEFVLTARDGTAGARITLNGSGAASVNRVRLLHSYVTVSGLTINGTNTPYQGQLDFWLRANHNVVSNCVVDSVWSSQVYGIRWETVASNQSAEASDNVIVKTEVRNVAGYPMVGMAGSRNVLRGCYVHDGEAVDFLRLTGISNLITGNVFSNNFVGEGGHPDFVQTFGNNGEIAYGHIIESNVVSHIPGGQLFQFGATGQKDVRDWRIRNNIFKHAALGGGGNVQGMKFHNNVFYKILSSISFSYRAFAAGTGINPGFPIYAEMTQPTPSGQLVAEGDGGIYRYGGWYQVKTPQVQVTDALMPGRVYEARTRNTGLIWYNGKSYINQQTFEVLPGITAWTETADVEGDLEPTQLYMYAQLVYMGKTYRRDDIFEAKAEDRTWTSNYPDMVQPWRVVVDKAHRGEMKNNVFLDCGQPLMWQSFYAFDGSLTNVSADYNYVGKDGFQPIRERGVPHYAVGDPRGWGGKGWWEDHGINGGDPGFIDFVNFQLRPDSILRGRGENGVNIGAYPGESTVIVPPDQNPRTPQDLRITP